MIHRKALPMAMNWTRNVLQTTGTQIGCKRRLQSSEKRVMVNAVEGGKQVKKPQYRQNSVNVSQIQICFVQ